MEDQYKYALLVTAIINFIYGGLFLPYTFMNQRCASEKAVSDANRLSNKKERKKRMKEIKRENRRCIKLITFYIDVFFKAIFLVFMIVIFYLSKSSYNFYDGVVDKKCTGTDITLNTLWDDYKKL